jgi:hypothetical protein
MRMSYQLHAAAAFTSREKVFVVKCIKCWVGLTDNQNVSVRCLHEADVSDQIPDDDERDGPRNVGLI